MHQLCMQENADHGFRVAHFFVPSAENVYRQHHENVYKDDMHLPPYL